jgi:hypothetical protein
MTTTTRAKSLTQLQALIAGTQKNFPSGTFTLGNTTYTTAALVQQMQDLGNALTALAAAHVQLADAGTTLKGVAARVNPVVRNYKRYLLSTYDNSPQKLADFGLQPLKARTPLTSDQRAAAKAKLTATRTARGTTSRKQKLTIKGDVTAVTITPVTSAPAAASSTPPPTPSPAVAASPPSAAPTGVPAAAAPSAAAAH